MTSIVRLCCVGLVVLSWVCEVQAFTFSVDPLKVSMDVPVGKRRGKTVRVSNLKSKQPIHLNIYVQDIVQLPDGTNNYLPPGSTEFSSANWLKITPTEIDIPADRIGDVRISAKVPEGAKGGGYAIVFFETDPSIRGDEGIGVNYRIGVIVEVKVPKTLVQQAKLVDLAFQEPNEVLVDIFNEGNVLVRPKGKIQILDAQGKRVVKIPFNRNKLGLLPNTLKKFSVKLDEVLVSGGYRVKAEIDYGTKYLLVGERPFTKE